MKRVSFDFDHTLSSLKIQHFAHSLIKQGIEVWICTARHSNENKLVDNWGNEDLFFVTDFLKIPQEQIIFCNYEEKRPFLEAESFEWHLDDDYMVINSLRDSFVPGIHCLQKGWMDKCIKILNLYKMNELSYEERLNILRGLHKDFVIIDTIFEGVEFDIVELTVIVKEMSTGKFFSTTFYQDTDTTNPKGWFEVNVAESPIYKEVFPKTVTKVIYE